ncbi:dienelactone hydrolase family protein [Psychrobacter sp. APC 3426]|uniref:dienelactone hydrolase family protein n=1 Tax=Psychrobacter sp. APC 3426 TaxID=3035177 RepID=UPI0025B562B1|nr:dienelactone hydrolase family protein [Psychrobacter sp. APC 3426]MDN3398464.1 dienelactone hydrolase family protein [Psychrobacter sp. APC 3426]
MLLTSLTTSNLSSDSSSNSSPKRICSLMLATSMGLIALSVSQTAAAIITKDITYTVDEQPYQGYYAKADKANAPFILLIHDWDGLTDYERKRADMLAKQGYNVFAADMFGTGVRPTELADKKRLTAALYDDRSKMRRLLQGALNAGQEQGNNVREGVTMGYCFGGSVALELARSGFPQKAFVPFHGGLELPAGQTYDKTKGQILVFHGSADEAVPLEDFTALGKTLEASKVPHEILTYSGAVHAFTDFNNPDRYDARADERSWRRYTDFLANAYK